MPDSSGRRAQVRQAFMSDRLAGQFPEKKALDDRHGLSRKVPQVLGQK